MAGRVFITFRTSVAHETVACISKHRILLSFSYLAWISSSSCTTHIFASYHSRSHIDYSRLRICCRNFQWRTRTRKHLLGVPAHQFGGNLRRLSLVSESQQIYPCYVCLTADVHHSVNVFYRINQEKSDPSDIVDPERERQEREFKIGSIGLADSAGILVASLLAVPTEVELCKIQIARGKDFCKSLWNISYMLRRAPSEPYCIMIL